MMLPDLSALAVHDVDDTGGIATEKLIRKRGIKAAERVAKPLIELPAPNEMEGAMESNSRLQLAPPSRYRAIKALFDNVNPEGLSQGRDQQYTWDYNTLTPVGVYDIIYKDNHEHVKRYKAKRATMSIAPGACNEFGTSEECVRTDAPLGDMYVDSGRNDLTTLNNKVNEKYLLHGTGIGGVKGIIYGGFEVERVTTAGFGRAIYLAEDPGKANHYAGLSASGGDTPKNLGWEDFNQILGLDTSGHKVEGAANDGSETYYMLVSRALLGCANHISHRQMGFSSGIQDLWKNAVYADYNKAQLRGQYDSLVKEHEYALRGGYKTGTKFREFPPQRNDQVLPVMLVAYVREKIPAHQRPTFDHTKFECDNIAPLVHLLQAGTDAQKEAAVRSLSQMSVDDAHYNANKAKETNERLMRAGAVTPTVALLTSGSDSAKRHAAFLLSTLLHWAWQRQEDGTRTDVRAMMLRANVLPPAVAFFFRAFTAHDTDEDMRLDEGTYGGYQGKDIYQDSMEAASLLLFSLVRGKQGRGDEMRVQLVEQGVVPMLLQSLVPAELGGQVGNVLHTLSEVVKVPEGAGAFFKSSGIPTLMRYFGKVRGLEPGKMPFRRAVSLIIFVAVCEQALAQQDTRPLVQIAETDLEGAPYEGDQASTTVRMGGIQALTRSLYDVYRSKVGDYARVINKAPDMAGRLLDMIADLSPEYKARVEFRLKADEPNKSGRRSTGARA